jgi:hypothetical protein
VDFLVQPNDSGYTDYYVPMGANMLWTGTIRAGRLDPIAAAGDFSMYRLALTLRGCQRSERVQLLFTVELTDAHQR